MSRLALRSPAAVAWRQDLERYGPGALHLEPTVYAVGAFRLAQWAAGRDGHRILRPLTRALCRIVGTAVGVELPPEARIGPGLRIHHGGAVVVHSRVVIGADCTLRQGVTLGERRADGPVPVLGDGVDVGAHAQVLGGIQVGEGARIGALALVMEDVPARGVARAPRALVEPARTSSGP